MASKDPTPAEAAPLPATHPTKPAIAPSAKPPSPPPSHTSAEIEIKDTPADDVKPKTSLSADPTDTAQPTTSPSVLPPPSSASTSVLDSQDQDFEGNVAVNNDIPTEKDLARVDDMLVLDARGQSRPFKDLYRGEGVAPRQLIIFVRHFFCGNCQEYLRELSASVSPESLLALPEPTFITVIGCGRPELIEMYTETTKCPFPIYAEPTRKLYDLLSMTRTLELGKKPEYIQSNLFVTSVQSIVQSLKTGSKALKGGDFKQVGGEFLFEDGKCVWAHRMRNTRDHAEIGELRELLGLGEAKSPLRKRWSHGIKMLKDSDRKRSSSWGRSKSKIKDAKEKEESKTLGMVDGSDSIAEQEKEEYKREPEIEHEKEQEHSNEKPR